MFFERHQGGERAVLVQLQLAGAERALSLLEFEELVGSAGGDPVATITGSRTAPHARTFVGEGKLEEIAQACKTFEADLVIFNHALSPSQERNLEQVLCCRVLARTGLILDIFAQRARTHEGKLQVELAQLTHMSTRLIRGWTHLERQKGGIGLRGPGETQLETDRRLLRTRIKSIQSRLGRVRNQREQSRRARRRAELPVLSLVGYTNAGKSTLFNAMTGDTTFASSQLFATLDTTVRKLELPSGAPVVLADTVGFIRDLPHDLVAAFRATLEEARDASLLLHVIDSADPERLARIGQVEAVLDEIDASEVPRLQVFNKIDLRAEELPRVERDEQGLPQRVFVSAQTGAGLAELRQAIAERIRPETEVFDVVLPPRAGRLRAQLFEFNAIRKESLDERGNFLLTVTLPYERLRGLCLAAGVTPPPTQRVIEEWEPRL